MIIRFAEEEVRHGTLPGCGIADPQDFHPIEDPPRLARALRRQWREGSVGIFDGFRIGVTQEPHKHEHYVSLLSHLFRNPLPEDNMEDAQVGDKRKAEEKVDECGLEVLEDLSRAFRTWVEDRQWLNMRLCVSC